MIAQHQIQTQRLKILPQQIQLLNLFFLNSLELEQHLQLQLEENPLLEVKEAEADDDRDELQSNSDQDDYQTWEEYADTDKPDYKTEYQNYLGQEHYPCVALSGKMNFKDEAKQQLHICDLAELDQRIGEFIIDNLDDHGFLTIDLEELADDLSFESGAIISVKDFERVLKVVQSFEPIGIGTHNIQECLLAQLSHQDRQSKEGDAALLLIRDHYDDLMHRQLEKIQHQLGFEEDDFKQVLSFISGLKFYPASENSSTLQPKTTIIPDFLISRFGDSVQISLQNSRSTGLQVNQSLYENLVNQTAAGDKSAAQYMKGKLLSAQWFVTAIRQREDTMMRIMRSIANFQKEYFLEGDIRKLKPMVLREIAAICDLDISTVSRITSNKYADTHFGQILLKDLFSEGIADEYGTIVSNKVIQSIIQETIAGENKKHPFTDLQIVSLLQAQGYKVARRTVAKYRDQLNIPTAQLRAVWA
ncbi:MAG: RNA polymerase factor sigma-54 [Bacteroidetes bacterium]|nr:RNA polymerase factor sigma-54 [Bacteroidota bacterium]